MKKGISLVALVITIIVLIILTAAVILTATNTNIFGKSEEAVFKNNVASFQEELTKKIMEKKLEDPTFSEATINATTSADIAQWIPSIAGTGYEDSFEIVGGKLIFTGTDTKQIEYVEKLGITASEAGGNSSSDSASGASEQASSGENNQSGSNPWITRGLTYSGVVYDENYYVVRDGSEKDAYTEPRILLNSTNGNFYGDDGMVEWDNLIVGTDYIIMVYDGNPSKNEPDEYVLYIFNGNGTATVYASDSDSASATKESIIANNYADAAEYYVNYAVSSGN